MFFSFIFDKVARNTFDLIKNNFSLDDLDFIDPDLFEKYINANSPKLSPFFNVFLYLPPI